MAQASAAPLPRLLTEEIIDPPVISPIVHFHRQRAARLGPALAGASSLTQPAHGQRLELNLFPETRLAGTVTRHDILGPGRGVYFGYLENSDLGAFIIAYDGDAMAASIWDARLDRPTRYEIRSIGDGIHVVGQIDEGAVPGCGMNSAAVVAQIPARLHLTPADRLLIAEKTAAKVVQLAEAAELGGGSGTGVYITQPAVQGAPTFVDVMLLYTDDARENNGGTSGINTILDLSLATANAAYANSGVQVELRLKHRQEIVYSETGNLATDLGNLSGGTGGLGSVPGLRNTHGADLVCLFVHSASAGGGLGNVYNGSASSGFSVVKASNPVDTYAHEVGHNQGCAHDRENASIAGFQSYSYGWRTLVNGDVQIRTIMAYAPGFPIPFFSNPDLQVNNVPAGVPIGQPLEASNAATINATAASVAGFRSASSNSPPIVSITTPAEGASFAPLQSITIQAAASDPGGSIAQVDFFIINNNLSTVHLGTDTTPPYSVTTTKPPAGEVRISAVARDNLGASTSAEVLIGIGAFYSVETISPLALFAADTTVTGINIHGTVAGYGTNGAGQTRAFTYANGTMTDLGTLSGHVSSEAKAINASGVVVGRSIPSAGNPRGFRYTPGVGMVDLNSIVSGLGGATIIDVAGISDAGHILLQTNAGNPNPDWFIWNGSTLTALQSAWNPFNITGMGMSPDGRVAGFDYSFTLNRFQAATWSTAGVQTLLPDLSDHGFARAVNHLGHAAGNVGNGSPTAVAVWIGGSGANLGSFGGDSGEGTSINGYDEVVGFASLASGEPRGFVRRDGTMRQVGDLVAETNNGSSDRWIFYECVALNDCGQIAGEGQIFVPDPDGDPETDDSAYFPRAFVLNPTAGLDARYWNATQFTAAELQNPAISGPNADPDGDQKSNLLERALNTDPRVRDNEHPAVEYSGGLLTISFTQLKLRNGLTYTVQVSSDLVTWTTVTTQLSRVSIDENSERIVMQGPAPGGSPPRQFIRLLVQAP